MSEKRTTCGTCKATIGLQVMHRIPGGPLRLTFVLGCVGSDYRVVCRDPACGHKALVWNGEIPSARCPGCGGIDRDVIPLRWVDPICPACNWHTDFARS